MRACRFSSVRSGASPANSRPERLVVGLARPARSAARARARRAPPASARASSWVRRGGEARGHDRRAHALGAERVGGEAGDERRVDPAGEAEHDVREAVLLDVVAQAERERRVDLGLERRDRRRQRARRPRRRRRPLAARRDAGSAGQHGHARRAAGEIGERTAPRWPASRRRAAAAASRSTSQTSSSSRNCAARAIVSPVWSTTKECPSKTSSSWPPTSAQKATQARLSRARWANIRSRSSALAGVVGRGGDVDDQRRARERLVAGRRAGLPDVLADGQPDALVADVDHGARRRPPGSSAARRRRRSWAGRPCGRSRAPRRRRARRRSCRRPRRARGSRRPRRCSCVSRGELAQRRARRRARKCSRSSRSSGG